MNMFKQIEEIKANIHTKVEDYVIDFFDKHKDLNYCSTLSRECVEGDNEISDSSVVSREDGFVDIEVCWYNYENDTYEYGIIGLSEDYFTDDL